VGDWNNGVMSRKITPGLGKSITGRIRDLMSKESKTIVEVSWLAANAAV
jgi:Na+-translocating ferredoxin:NAD+ oxidoreductase RnfG subunit